MRIKFYRNDRYLTYSETCFGLCHRVISPGNVTAHNSNRFKAFKFAVQYEEGVR